MSEGDYTTVSNAALRSNTFFNTAQPYTPQPTHTTAAGPPQPYSTYAQQQQQQQRPASNASLQQQQQRIPPQYNSMTPTHQQQPGIKQPQQPQSGPGRGGGLSLAQQMNGMSLNGYNGVATPYSPYNNTNNNQQPELLTLGSKQTSTSSQSSLPLNFASVAAGLNQSMAAVQELPRVFDNSEFPALSTMGNPVDIDKALQPNASQTTSVIHDDFPALNSNSNNSSTAGSSGAGLSSMDSELRKTSSSTPNNSRGAVGTAGNSTARYNNAQQQSSPAQQSSDNSNGTGGSSSTDSSGQHQHFGGTSNMQSRLFGLPTPVTTQLPAAPPSTQPAQQRSTPAPSQQTSAASSTKSKNADKYSILGLLPVIRRLDPDLSMLSLGTDLQTLGLNLNSSDMLYATFGSPLSDVCVRSEPDYVLPHCYYQQPPPLKTSHLTKFTLETLFYIFYNMPKDTLQLYAAKELYNRQWRYHKDVKLWFVHSSKVDVSQMGGGGADASEYVYFDINAWEKKWWRDSAALRDDSKFMTEQELTTQA